MIRPAALLLLTATPLLAQERHALVPVGHEWRYALAADAGPGACDPSFDDAGWAKGPSGFGFGDDDDATPVALDGDHVALVLRTRFDASEANAAARAILVVRSDDGFVAWLNGTEIARARVQGDPPPPDALAEDHEATRAEEFVLADGVLRPGTNVLCVQAHDSDPRSSDFTIEPQLVVENRRIEDVPFVSFPQSRWRFTTTAAAFHVSNYFQGRAGSDEEGVTGVTARQEAWRRFGREDRTMIRLHAEGSRYESLGTGVALGARVSRRFGSHEAWADADARWNRPAFRLGDDLARSDSAGLELGWSKDAGKALRVSAWIAAAREHLDLDARRDNHDVSVGASLRMRRDNRRFSPEAGVELDRRTAGAEPFEFEQRRAFLRVRSRPSDRISLSGLVRIGFRDYASARDDRRRTVRLTTDVEIREALTFTSFLSWDDGQSSLEGRAFDSTMTWAGIRFRY